MNAKEFLNKVCSNIKYKPARKQISEELKSHIEEVKEENIYKGYSEKEAEEIAVNQMGDATQIGKKLNRIHRPKLDWITLIFVILLILLSGNYMKFMPSNLYYAFYENNAIELNNFMNAKMECIIFTSVILFAVALYFWDYRKICKHSNAIYIIATLLNIIAYIRGFRANGNLIYGLWPITSVSPTVFSIPLYIIAFAGFMKNIDKKSKIEIIISANRKINFNIIKTIMLSALAIITSLMINFVSGFLITTIYTIIAMRELIIRKNIKHAIIFIAFSIIMFAILSTIICIIPTNWNYRDNDLTSEYWVGIDTVGKRRVNTIRKEILEKSKMFGQADLEENAFKDNYNIQNYFSTTGSFALVGYISRYGWIVGIALTILMILFNIKLIASVKNVKEQYGKIVLIGFSSFYIIQTICNIAMNFGIIGVAEFYMPFFTFGKVELLMNIISISVMLSIYRRKDINFEEPQKSKILAQIDDYFFEEC